MVYLACLGALFGNLGNAILAPKTSPFAFLGVAAGVGSWLATEPVRTLGRLAQMWAPVVVGLTIAVGVLGLQDVHWPRAILPTAAPALGPVVSALWRSAYLWVPYPVLLTLVRRIRPRTGRVPFLVMGAPGRSGWCCFGSTPSWWARWAPGRPFSCTGPTVFVYDLIAVSTFLIAQVGALVVVLWTVTFVAFWAIQMWHVGVLVRGAAARPATPVIWAGTALSAALGGALTEFPHLTQAILSSVLGGAIGLWTVLSLASLALRAAVRRPRRWPRPGACKGAQPPRWRRRRAERGVGGGAKSGHNPGGAEPY